MSDNISTEAAKVVSELGEANGVVIDKITKRIVLKAETLQKIKKLVSLFDDEVPNDAKEPEILGYFLEKGFEALVTTGEIDRRVKAVLGQ